MDQEKKLLLIAGVFAALVLGNLLFLDYKTINTANSSSEAALNQSLPNATPEEVPNAPPIATSSSGCDTNCQNYIDSKITAAKQEIIQSLSTPQVVSPPTTSVTSQSTQPSNIYVDFGANGATQSNSWTDIPGSQISFNKANYPGAKAFYLDANLRSDAPDRGTWARIVDSGSGLEIIGSEISISGSLTSVFEESGPLNLPSGNLSLKLQAHDLSLNNAYVEGARIRVSY